MHDFPGRDQLIGAIERHCDANGARPDRMRDELEALFRAGTVTLPLALLQPHPEHYARRAIHISPEHGYALIAMIWGPGQSSPLHDHDGNWCVECIWQGGLSITRHTLREEHDGRVRFEHLPPLRAVAGQGDWMEAPNEHHTMTNPDPDVAAISLHVYPHTFSHCCWFEPLEDGWHRRHQRQLGLDAWA